MFSVENGLSVYSLI